MHAKPVPACAALASHRRAQRIERSARHSCTRCGACLRPKVANARHRVKVLACWRRHPTLHQLFSDTACKRTFASKRGPPGSRWTPPPTHTHANTDRTNLFIFSNDNLLEGDTNAEKKKTTGTRTQEEVYVTHSTPHTDLNIFIAPHKTQTKNHSLHDFPKRALGRKKEKPTFKNNKQTNEVPNP